MSNPTHVGIYTRISDDRNGDAAGVGRQEADCRTLADRLDWTVAEVFVENDVSAFKRRAVTLPDGTIAHRVVRPEFRRMLDLLAAGSLDGLIAYDLDRLARDPRDLEDLIDVIEQRHAPVESVTGSLRLGTDSGIMTARVMVAVANDASRATRRRIKRQQDDAATAGRHHGGGARRYGFEIDGVTHKPDEVRIIRWAAQEVIDGASARSVAAELGRRGVRTVRGGEWSPKTLSDILRGPRVAGLRVHRGEVVGSAAWRPILDEDTYAAVVAALAGRSNGNSAPVLKYWLTGLLFCGHCGHPLVGKWMPHGMQHRYWCNSTRGGCGRIAVLGPPTETEIERQVLDYLTRPDVLDALAAVSSPPSTARARADLAEDEGQLRDLARLWAEKTITLGEYAEARKIIETRIAATKKIVSSVVPARVREVLATDDVAAAWNDLGPNERREVVHVLAKGWRVHPAKQTQPRRFNPERLEVIERDGVGAP